MFTNKNKKSNILLNWFVRTTLGKRLSLMLVPCYQKANAEDLLEKLKPLFTTAYDNSDFRKALCHQTAYEQKRLARLQQVSAGIPLPSHYLREPYELECGYQTVTVGIKHELKDTPWDRLDEWNNNNPGLFVPSDDLLDDCSKGRVAHIVL